MQAQLSNKLTESNYGKKAYVQEVQEFGNYLVASIMYIENPFQASTILHNDLKYVLLDKRTGNIAKEFYKNAVPDTAYWISNVYISGDILNIYYHQVLKHSSSYLKNVTYVMRYNAQLQLIEEKPLLSNVVSGDFYTSPSFYFENNGRIHEIYREKFFNKSNALLQHKSYDALGHELSYQRLNKMVQDSFYSFDDESLLPVKILNNKICFLTVLNDSIPGSNPVKFWVYDKDMNYEFYRTIRAEQDYDSDTEYYTEPLHYTFDLANANLLDLTDTSYVLGGLMDKDTVLSMYNETFQGFGPGFVHRSLDSLKPNKDFYTEMVNTHSPLDSILYRYYGLGHYAVQYRNYPMVGRGNNHYILSMPFSYGQLKDSSGQTIYNPFTGDQIYVKRMNKNFEDQLTFFVLDSNQTIDPQGCMVTTEGYSVVYGSIRNYGGGNYQYRPYILVIDNRGNPLGGLHAENTYSSRELILYPNPTRELLHLPQWMYPYRGTYKIVDISGQVIKFAEFENSVIDLGSVPSGQYLIQIQCKEQIYTSRFVKK